jgi:hypothetical protein
LRQLLLGLVACGVAGEEQGADARDDKDDGHQSNHGEHEAAAHRQPNR